MTPERWNRAKEIFGAAIEMDPSSRERFVRDAAADDEALLTEVMSLLQADTTQTISVNPAALPPVPALLKERYRIERAIGRGGLGVVFLARDEALHDRPVVIKMPLERSLSDPWLAAKFAQEVKALAVIDHPGVVGALDSGTTADGRPFLVMQYVEGRPLEDCLSPEGLPLERAAHVVRELGRALGAAHAKSIWHRDVKPSNILLQRLEDGEHVRLIDFGIATIHETQEGEVGTQVAGTPPYMAPEQLQGRVSHASDIWAMGVVAYELVAGRKPFVAENIIQLLDLQKVGPAIRPRVLRPALPEKAERLILESLSFHPQDRPQGALVFGEELAAALTSSPEPRNKWSRRAIFAAAGMATLGIGAAAFWRLRPTLEVRLTYSLMLQHGGQPNTRPMPVPVDFAFRPLDGFFVVIRPAESGHLYILSDDRGADALTMLFPSPLMYRGLSLLNANEPKQIPAETWYTFDEKPGAEDLWFVWSRDVVPELERETQWINERDRGYVKDVAERTRLRQLVASTTTAITSRSKTAVEETVTSSAERFSWKLHMETKKV